MPLGGSHGPRPGKVADKEREKSRIPMLGLSRKSSVTSTTSTSTKATSSTSWFSRGRRKQETAPLPVTAPTTSATTGRILRKPSDVVSSRSEPLSRTRQPEPSRHAPSSALGLGVITSITSEPMYRADVEDHRTSTLRRKPSSIDQRSRFAHTESLVGQEDPNLRDNVSSPEVSTDQYSASVFGVALPAVSASSSYLPTRNAPLPDQATSSSHMANYNAYRAPKTPTPQLLPPLAPSFTNSSGSSTRRSESPGSFSRTSTPTSVSSYSPGIPATTKSPLRTRYISPTRSRPPVTRNWPGNSSKQELGSSESQGLSAVQELATSSSSSDTVRGTERSEQTSRDRRTPQEPARQTYSPLVGSRDQAFAKESAPPGLNSPPKYFGVPTHDSFSQVALSASQIPTKTPPPRPSREGTPRLEDVVASSPIIRSNLSHLETTGHKRRDSLEKPLFYSGIKGENSSSNHPLRSTKSSRLPSPTTVAAAPSRTWPAETARPRLPSRAGSRDGSVGRGRELTPTTTATSKPSRFGLFSRRTSPVRSATADPVEKAVKKGPAAGTGHEGYGKYARRGRSGSAGSSASRGRSTSSNGTISSVARTPNSRKSSFTSREEPEMDDFLRDRLSPVIISGGRVSNDQNSGADLYRTTSGASSVSIVTSDNGSLRGSQGLESRTMRKLEGPSMTISSTMPSRRAPRTLPQGQENLVAAFDSDLHNSARPTLATRRSLHRSRLLKDDETFRGPSPIDTRKVAPSPAMNSSSTLQSSALRTGGSSRLTDDISEGREGNWLKSKKAEKPSKSPSKWNFFQRANAAQKKPSSRRPSQDQERPQELPVAVTRLPQARSVPHYAMIDNNGQDVDDPEGLVPNLKDLDLPLVSQQSPPTSRLHSALRRQEHKQSMLLPSPPTMAGEFTNVQEPPSPKILLRHQAPFPKRPVEASKASESRLQQVGRIPRVVSKRDRPHKPPPQSFSRPFVREHVPEQDHISATPQEEQSYVTDRPILGIQTEVIPSDPWGDPYSGKPASAPARAPAQPSSQGGDEFLIIPQRQGSQVSGSSSSGVVSFVLAAPESKRPSQPLHEEDVWNEYDDFLDTVESPAPLPVDPFENINKRNSPPKARMTPAPLQIRKGSTSSTHSNPAQDLPPMTLAPTSALPSPPSRMTLLSPNLASSPMSFSDFIAGYGDRNRSSGVSKRQSSVSGSRYSQPSLRSSIMSDDNAESKRHTQIMAEKTRNSSGSQSNLRFSALMTSRWLSFGRVLFSPAHDEIQTTKQDRVLVLDGLGNDDWSFYCALTYPDATVYNLSSFKRMGSASSRKRELGSVQSPPNHRQIFHAGMAAPFPFPKGYFSAAVFRFPAATTETAYYNAVSECKRVLRPGGYLEISILDLDMVNMGNRARRAVRGLKVKMQVAQPSVSLKPVSDNIQKMLGRRGFENLNRCMVTVPVAGLVPDSRAGSLDEKDLSLGDMLKDHSAQGDESITKMVSRVGRWWYTRCYEYGVLANPDEDSEHSIWGDRALLKECEKFETGLKLLICYAQKPER
ncbi:MAG: hypothetical protein Q9218_005081, partial [Villophora microphyllina]